jgi:hypothetical protein
MNALPELSVNRLKEALETFEWAQVLPLLDGAGDALDADEVSEALRRAGGLILKYPASSEKRRDELLAKLEAYLASKSADQNLPESVRSAIQTIRIGEAGYRKLVGELAATDASKLEPAVHVAAALRRAEEEVSRLRAEFAKQSAKGSAISLQVTVQDEAGDVIDMDAALENFIDFVSMTLQMEGHKNKWLNGKGEIVVPSLPEVTDEAVYQVGSTWLLATLWSRWQATEEGARVLGRTLRFLEDSERPADAPDSTKRFILEEGDDTTDFLHRVALERVTDKLSQNLVEIATSTTLKGRQPTFRLPGGARVLPPHDWISDEELHGLWALEQYLAYDVRDDMERPGGLRLVEWVRGYCVLMSLARGSIPGGMMRTRAGWQDFFGKYGLSLEASETLISSLTFRRSSRDLFDHPFIHLADGRLRLFATALRVLNVPLVVLSTLSQRSIQLKRKGKAFEEVVRQTFDDAGVKAYAFKARRNGEEYEYDAVVPWGDTLFVLECKNMSLPFGSKVQMHYFDLSTASHIKQLKRLEGALRDYPDIIGDNLPPEAATMKIVPVLLNCFPYSAPGLSDGVYLYDYSALARFFTSAEIMVKSASTGKGVVEFPTGVRLWAGDSPTANDLIEQLELSHQFKTVADSLMEDRRDFPLLPDWYVFGKSLSRGENPDLAVWRDKALLAKSGQQSPAA